MGEGYPVHTYLFHDNVQKKRQKKNQLLPDMHFARKLDIKEREKKY